MASSQIETVTTGADKARLAVAVVFVVGAFAAFYLLASPQVSSRFDFVRWGALVQWGALLVGLVAAVGVFATTEQGRRLVGFFRDAWREVKKVVWPTRKEAMQMTGFVFAFVAVMSIFLWMTDKSLEWVFFDLILGWRK